MGNIIPTDVKAIGQDKFTVTFVPMESIDHMIEITFNKSLVPGAPFIANVEENGTSFINICCGTNYENY